MSTQISRKTEKTDKRLSETSISQIFFVCNPMIKEQGRALCPGSPLFQVPDKEEAFCRARPVFVFSEKPFVFPARFQYEPEQLRFVIGSAQGRTSSGMPCTEQMMYRQKSIPSLLGTLTQTVMISFPS